MEHKTSISIKKEKDWSSYYRTMDGIDIDLIRKARVMVVGSGALGNEVLKNLTLLGVGNVLIVDFDIIEYANLTRSILFRESDSEAKRSKVEVAAERIKEINPAVKLKTINGDISVDVGLGVFRRMDVVIGCLDNRYARLYINRLCNRVNIPWIDGGIVNLGGQMTVYMPGQTCFECNLKPRDWEIIEQRERCGDIAKRNMSNGKVPTSPLSGSIIAALQVQEALKIIQRTENIEDTWQGKRFYFEGLVNFINVSKLATGHFKEDCLSNFTYTDIIEAEHLNSDMTIKELLSALKVHFDTNNVAIELDFELILEISPEESEGTFPLIMLKPHFSDKIAVKYRTKSGERIQFSKTTNMIEDDFPYPEKTLSELGIPKFHILRVFADGELQFVELTGDQSFLTFE